MRECPSPRLRMNGMGHRRVRTEKVLHNCCRSFASGMWTIFFSPRVDFSLLRSSDNSCEKWFWRTQPLSTKGVWKTLFTNSPTSLGAKPKTDGRILYGSCKDYFVCTYFTEEDSKRTRIFNTTALKVQVKVIVCLAVRILLMWFYRLCRVG